MYNLRVQLPRAQASIQTRGAKVITAGLKVGEKAPEFSLKDQVRHCINIVMFFYLHPLSMYYVQNVWRV